MATCLARSGFRKLRLRRLLPCVLLAGALGCTGDIGAPARMGAAGSGGSVTGAAGTGLGSGTAGGGPGGALGTAGAAGGGTQCTPLAPIQRRLWRLSAEQWGNAVRDLLALPSRPAVLDTGGQNEYAFFADTTLGMTPEFQFALYDATQTTVLPAIASKIGGASGTHRPLQRHDRVGADGLRANASSRRSRRKPTAVPSTRPRSRT